MFVYFVCVMVFNLMGIVNVQTEWLKWMLL